MGELWKNLIHEIKKLDSDLYHPFYADSTEAKYLLFDFFCLLSAKKILINQDQIAKLKDLISEKRRAFGELFAYLDASFGGFEGNDEWGRFCIDRSVLQFIVDLFQNDIERLYPNIQTDEFEEFDERMASLAYMEGCYPPEKIPEGVPYSHWWWSRTGP
jgi:hypothetical protein